MPDTKRNTNMGKEGRSEMSDGPKRATPYSTCIECTIGTRSHVLEEAEWDIIEVEEVIAESDEYANKTWEETEMVEKWIRTSEPVVMCHKCWMKQLDKITRYFYDKIFIDNWEDSVDGNRVVIRRYLRKWARLGFSNSSDVEQQIKADTKTVQRVMRRLVIGE